MTSVTINLTSVFFYVGRCEFNRRSKQEDRVQNVVSLDRQSVTEYTQTTRLPTLDVCLLANIMYLMGNSMNRNGHSYGDFYALVVRPSFGDVF